MSDTHRYTDEGVHLDAFAGEVWVTCIHCQTPGAIHAAREGLRWHARFDCAVCDLNLDAARGDWVGPMTYTGRRPCGFCGHQWLCPHIKQSGWPREVLTSVDVICEACHHSSTVELTGYRGFNASGHDPHFGMPLWLVDSGRHGSIWAYNAAHIAVLKAYVGATLRERSHEAGNASMISRLPAWMKAAKNRDAVIQRLGKLERQLASAGTACPPTVEPTV